ncbi:MAG: hypothetical protein HUU55_01230 [Myxococcales bacterium]|nr:hypothetical protein [Myxococcales bacterium]
MKAQMGAHNMNGRNGASGATRYSERRGFTATGVGLFCIALVTAVAGTAAANECVNPFNGVILSPLGDINGDGNVNVIDAHCGIILSLWELGGQVGAAPACAAQPLSKADVNCSGTVNVIDVNILITLALNQPLSSGVDPSGTGCAAPCQPLGYVPLPMVLPIYSTGESTGGGFSLRAIGTGAATTGSSASPDGGAEFELKPKSEGIPQEIP